MVEVVRREAPWCLGLSTGLVYNPAVYSDQREITALVRAFNDVKPGALYPHLRSESDDIEDALGEVVTAAVDGGGGYCTQNSPTRVEWRNVCNNAWWAVLHPHSDRSTGVRSSQPLVVAYWLR